jgi:hypothetical protein
MKKFAVTYSYATWDPHYRGQIATVIEALDERDALDRIRKGSAGTAYGPTPSAEIVRIRERAQ